MQFDAKLTHSLCHVFYATTLQISRLRQEIADLKSKLESTEDNFNKLRAEHTGVLSRLEEYEEAGDVPSASDPGNYNKDGKRTRKAEDRSRFLWKFVQRYACGGDFAPHNYVNEEGKAFHLTGEEWEVLNYLKKPRNRWVVTVMLAEPSVQKQIAEIQLKAVKAHEKTEKVQSLSLAASLQLKLGKRKMRKLHSRLFEELTEGKHFENNRALITNSGGKWRRATYDAGVGELTRERLFVSEQKVREVRKKILNNNLGEWADPRTEKIIDTSWMHLPTDAAVLLFVT